jgi:hypothetical protein
VEEQMKQRSHLVLLLCAIGFLSIPVFAQPISHLDTMKPNVEKITDPAEKERWLANIDLWTVKMAETGTGSAEDATKMKASLDQMKANVKKISDAKEKERWNMNIHLWEKYMNPTPSNITVMRLSLNELRKNIEGIQDPAEKERWQANYQLWQVAVAKQ